MQSQPVHFTLFGRQNMIPNLDQLLLVCGIALAGVALIVWVLVKIPDESKDEREDDGFGRD